MIYAMFVGLLRFLFAVCDRRRLMRVLSNRPKLDVVMVSNFRDQIDVRNFGYKGRPLPFFLRWIRFHWEKLSCQLYMIGSLTDEVQKEEGIKKARVQFKEAAMDAQKKGAKAVLFAANLKRIMKNRASEELPGLIPTIGDNFTSLLVIEEAKRAMKILELKKPRIAVLGASGILGSAAFRHFNLAGYDAVGLTFQKGPARKKLCEGLSDPELTDDWNQLGRVDLVIACTHADRELLTEDKIELLRKHGKRLVVIDVAEPPNLTEEVYKKVMDKVIRFDAGNGYSAQLKYVLGFVAYRILRLADGVIWGCFCETMIIAKHLKDDPDISGANWMEVTEKNIEIVSRYFGKKGGFGLPPEPLCYGRRIKDFKLEIKEEGHAGIPAQAYKEA